MIDDWSWEFPYVSRRSPVLARNVVTTSQPLAAQAGLSMLKEGGNAVDAALATAIALTVLEPCSNGVGSDLFSIVWDGKKLFGLNASGLSPQAWSLPYFQERITGENEGITYGWDSVTVPGAVAGWVSLSERFGVLPFARLFEPAIHYARNGFAVTPLVHKRWMQEVENYRDYPCFAEQFLPGGHVPRVGQLYTPPYLADTLISIARSRGESFYRGELARKIAADAAQNGAALKESDLAAHSSSWVDPVAIRYGDIEVYELPPNSQGIAVLQALGILDHFDLARYPVDSVDSVHLQVEAMKLAFTETFAHAADPRAMRISTGELLDADRLAGLAAGINQAKAGETPERGPQDGGTVYLSAADDTGTMVSLIQSNYWGFGSGIVVPGTGISLQNRGAGFVLEEGHPNCVAGGKRPFHTIIPGFVMHGDRPLLSFGVMGGHMQAQGHVQMVTRIFDYGQNPQAACDAPRWQLDKDMGLTLEKGAAPALVTGLRDLGHRFTDEQPQYGYGGAQLVYCMPDGGYCAASDHRKDGQAAGF